MKRLLAKFILLALVTVPAQLLIVQHAPWQQSDMDTMRQVASYLRERCDVLYFTDSVDAAYGLNDKDRRLVSERVRDDIPGHTMQVISHASFGLDTYRDFADYILDQPNHPRLLIVPINMRTFSVGMDLRPGYQFEQLRFYLRHNNNILIDAAYPFLLTFKALKKSSLDEEEFLRQPIFNGDTRVGEIKDFDEFSPAYRTATEENIRKQLIACYMYSLKEDHRKLQAMAAIAQHAKKAGVKVIFYITPIDWQTGEKYLGAAFSQRLRENVDLVRSMLARAGYTPIDLSFALKSDEFAWIKYVNEHMNEKGKGYVAKILAERIKAELDSGAAKIP
jgi:hypothetical protein